jgi:L-iditol 2-dehydrogenase
MQALKTMQALFIDGPKKVRFEDVPIPSILSHEVLIRVHCVGVCATDLEIYDGSMIYFQTGQATFPIIPGHEWSGEIIEIGEDVEGLCIGDRVVGETTISCGHCGYCAKGRYNLCPYRVENGVIGKHGACAEYMAFPAHAIHRFDRSISYEEAALIETSAVAYRGVEKLKITPEDHVLVIGAGPVGLLSVQMAKVFGASKVTLIDLRENRLEMGRRLGADETIDLTKLEQNEPTESFTAIIEATGNPSGVESVFSYAAPAARVCMLGLCGGRKAQLNVDKLVTYDMEIHGSLGSPGVWNTVIKLLESGKLKTKELITHRFPMGDIEQAFVAMEAKDPSVIKILLNHINS